MGGSRRTATARRLALRPSAAGEAQHGEGPSTSGRGPAPGHSHGYAHHHAPPPLGALPDRRGAAGMRSLHGVHSPVLRSLALSTVAIPRRQLQERYGGAATEGAGHEAGAGRTHPPRALAAQAQVLLPGPLRLDGALAAPDRRAAPAAAPAAEEEKPLSTEALTLVLLSTAVAFICSIGALPTGCMCRAGACYREHARRGNSCPCQALLMSPLLASNECRPCGHERGHPAHERAVCLGRRSQGGRLLGLLCG